MAEEDELERGFLVWVDESKLDAVVEILSDDQTLLGDPEHYELYEKLINYFKDLKIVHSGIITRRKRR